MDRTADEGTMRCLYCGNELALLKKLTGYGEFCSEAHRQKYQEQYNRLALTRLLQAQDSEPERRPPLSRTPVRPASTLPSGKPVRELDSAPVSPPDPPPVPSVDPPGLRGFLSPNLEPALSPTELFSSDPFLAPVTACLPGSAGGRTVDSEAGVPPVRPVPADLAGPPLASHPGASSGVRWTLLGLARPLDLALERIAGSALETESSAPFEFSAEYEHTIGQLACLEADFQHALAEGCEQPNPEAPRALPGTTSRNGSLNGRAKTPVPPPPEPDAALFEAARKPTPGTHARPPVVINFAALGIIDPEFDSEPDPAPPLPQREAETAGPEILPPRTRPGAPEPVVVEGPAESGVDRDAVVSHPLDAAPLTSETLVLPQRVPLLCSEPAILELRLAADAFTPIDDARFDAPVFEVQTPTVATCPLRPKVVFGPSPVVALPESDSLREADPSAGEPSCPAGPVNATRVDAPITRDSVPVDNAASISSGAIAEVASEQDEQTAKPEIEVLAAEENPRLKSRRRIAELTRKLGQRTDPVPVASNPTEAAPATPAEAPSRAPDEGVTPVEAIPPQAERARRQPADLDTLRREIERKAAPGYGAPPKSRRVAVVVALIMALLLLGYLLREAFAAKTDPNHSLAPVEVHGPALIAGEGGWSLEWNDGENGRQVEVFRPSLTMSDYRFEFQGQIEAKALGWMFRAVNPRNYYAIKLELIDVNGNPKAALTKVAFINGEETQKTQTILRTRVRAGMVFKVRTDVFGSAFRTYIQDEMVDTWIDDRLKMGGVGLLKEKDELADVRLIQLHELRVVN